MILIFTVLLAQQANAEPSVCYVHLGSGFTQDDVQSIVARGYHVISVNKINIQMADQLKDVANFGKQNEFMIYRSTYPEGLSLAYKVLPDRWEKLSFTMGTNLSNVHHFPLCSETRELTSYAYQWVRFGEPARDRLDSFYSTQKPVPGLGQSILGYEHFLTGVRESSAAAVTDQKNYENLVRSVHDTFYNSTAYEIKEKINVIWRILQPYVGAEGTYRENLNRMLDELHRVGGNCQSRAIFYISILNDASLDWGDDYQPGIEVFDDHVEPVLFSIQHQEVYELISGQLLQKPRADILHPEVITWAFLNSMGRATDEERSFKLVLESGPLFGSSFNLSRLFSAQGPILNFFNAGSRGVKQTVNSRSWGKSASHAAPPTPKKNLENRSNEIMEFHKVQPPQSVWMSKWSTFFGATADKHRLLTAYGRGQGPESGPDEEIRLQSDYSKAQEILGFDSLKGEAAHGRFIVLAQNSDKEKQFLAAPGVNYKAKSSYLTEQKLKQLKASPGYLVLLRVQDDPSLVLSLSDEEYHQGLQTLQILKDLNDSRLFLRFDDFDAYSRAAHDSSSGFIKSQEQLLNQLMVAKPDELVRFSRFFAEFAKAGTSAAPLKVLLELVLLKYDFVFETPQIEVENLHNFLKVGPLQKSSPPSVRKVGKRNLISADSKTGNELFFGTRIRPEVYVAVLLAQPLALLQHPVVQIRNMFLWRAKVHDAYLRYFGQEPLFKTSFQALWALSPLIYSTVNLARLFSYKIPMEENEFQRVKKTFSQLQHLRVTSQADLWISYDSPRGAFEVNELFWPISAFNIPAVVRSELETNLKERKISWSLDRDPSIYPDLQQKMLSWDTTRTVDDEDGVGIVNFGGLNCWSGLSHIDHRHDLKCYFEPQGEKGTVITEAIWRQVGFFVKVKFDDTSK